MTTKNFRQNLILLKHFEGENIKHKNISYVKKAQTN